MYKNVNYALCSVYLQPYTLYLALSSGMDMKEWENSQVKKDRKDIFCLTAGIMNVIYTIAKRRDFQDTLFMRSICHETNHCKNVDHYRWMELEKGKESKKNTVNENK